LLSSIDQDVQRFVVAHQDDDPAAGGGRLFLQPHEEVEGGADVLTVVDQVARWWLSCW